MVRVAGGLRPGADDPFVKRLWGCVPQGRFATVQSGLNVRSLWPREDDDLPEMAFYMVGDINEAIAKADELAKQVA